MNKISEKEYLDAVLIVVGYHNQGSTIPSSNILREGSIIKRLGFVISGITIGKEYIISSVVKQKNSNDWFVAYYKNDNDVIRQVYSLKNWEIIQI